MKRIAAWILCSALTVGVFTGCSREKEPYVPTGNALVMDDGSTVDTHPTEQEEAQEQNLTMVYYAEKSMNPLVCSDFTNRTLFSLIYQGLFSVDRNYEVEPVLCKSYAVSDDMMTYRFILETAYFSDGSRVTDADVVASLQAARESNYYKGRFLYVSSIEEGENGGVVIRLITPYENLPILLDIPILKVSQIEAEYPVGSGPYVFEQGIGGARLRKNTGWWCIDRADMPVTASSITLLKAESPAQIRDEFEFGDVNLVCANPASDSYADYRSDYELWDCDNGNFLYIACNMDSEVFSNSTVRAALTYAIDREKLADTYYNGFARMATLPASPQSPYYDEGLAERYEYDGVKFANAVSESGMKDSVVKLMVNKDDSLRLRVARQIGQMLTDCGLVVEMQELSTSDYADALIYRTYDLYVGQTKLSPNMDLSSFFYAYGELSYGNLDDSGLYAMCVEALANSGNYYDLHKMVMDDGRLCPVLFCGNAVYATRGVASDLQPSRDNVFYYSLGKTMEDALLS